MPIETPRAVAAAEEHAVAFYDTDAELAGIVGHYLARGLLAGVPAVVIATSRHQELFAAGLAAGGFDVPRLEDAGRLIMLDAAETLAGFSAGGDVDAAGFDRIVGGPLRRVVADGGRVCAYGEMVALLWDDGHVLAAIELERLWNQLLAEVPASLLCAYPKSLVHDSAGGDLEQVCQAHAEVYGLAPSGETFTEDFSAEPTAASAARRLVARALIGDCDRSVSDTAQLIASELATNAIRHARSDFRVTVRRDRYRVRLEVSDRSVARPVARTPTLGAASGWGLKIIDVLAAGWGVDPSPDGKTVWVELDT